MKRGPSLREQAEALLLLADLEDERNAAYEVREEDPERWKAAKHAYRAEVTRQREQRAQNQVVASVQTANGNGEAFDANGGSD